MIEAVNNSTLKTRKRRKHYPRKELLFTVLPEMRRLLNLGFTQLMVADQFDVSPTAVSRWLRKYGSASEQTKLIPDTKPKTIIRRAEVPATSAPTTAESERLRIVRENIRMRELLVNHILKSSNPVAELETLLKT